MSRQQAVGVGALAAVLLAGCSQGATAASLPRAAARGVHREALAGGKLDALPTGAVFLRIQSFAQPPGDGFLSNKHQVGMIYEAEGVQTLLVVGQPTIVIPPDSGQFLPSLAHQHTNTGPLESRWYFIALWPSSARGQPPVQAAAVTVYDSADLRPDVLRGQFYTETLLETSLEPAGASAVHRYGGLALVFVLEGAVTLAVGGENKTYSAGHAALVLPMMVLAERNMAPGASRFITFVITPDGTPFEILT